jgi:wyosine [tRNA(Phe)-imidazoG37] synthetase (radical SAM superfamily)
VGKIQPARVHLNTVSRPPAEGFAMPVSGEQMNELKGFFPGHVDIIVESEQDTQQNRMLHHAGQEEILALLSRRPCTLADVANGLGVHMAEALKHLDALLSAGKIKAVARGQQSFYVPQAMQKDA